MSLNFIFVLSVKYFIKSLWVFCIFFEGTMSIKITSFLKWLNPFMLYLDFLCDLQNSLTASSTGLMSLVSKKYLSVM